MGIGPLQGHMCCSIWTLIHDDFTILWISEHTTIPDFSIQALHDMVILTSGYSFPNLLDIVILRPGYLLSKNVTYVVFIIFCYSVT